MILQKSALSSVLLSSSLMLNSCDWFNNGVHSAVEKELSFLTSQTIKELELSKAKTSRSKSKGESQPIKTSAQKPTLFPYVDQEGYQINDIEPEYTYDAQPLVDHPPNLRDPAMFIDLNPTDQDDELKKMHYTDFSKIYFPVMDIYYKAIKERDDRIKALKDSNPEQILDTIPIEKLDPKTKNLIEMVDNAVYKVAKTESAYFKIVKAIPVYYGKP